MLNEDTKLLSRAIVLKQNPPKTSKIHEEDSNGKVVDNQEGSCEVI